MLQWVCATRKQGRILSLPMCHDTNCYNNSFLLSGAVLDAPQTL